MIPLRAIVVVLLSIAGLAALYAGTAWGVVSLTGINFKDAAASVQGIGTLVVLSVGGAFAYYRLQMYRSFEPHLTVTHAVSHRRIGDSFVHIAVSANLYNSSRVKVDVHEWYFRLHQIAPATDPEIERLYDQAFSDGELGDIQWPTLEQISSYWPEDPIVVEPGESHTETVEFIVGKEVHTALIYSYFHNSTFSENSQNTEGWDASTIYDIHDTMTA